MEESKLLNDTGAERTRLCNLFLKLAIFFGIIFIFLEPPFVCPDENYHFVNICRVSRGEIFTDTEDGVLGCHLSDEELDFLKNYGARYHGVDSERFDFKTMDALSKREASDKIVFWETDYAKVNSIVYMPAAIIVAVLRLILGGINAYNTLMVSKIVNLFIYALIGRWAIKKTHAYEKTMFFLMLLPMALFQGASASYDAILIPCACLLFALATKLLSNEITEVTRGDIVMACVAFAGLLVTKFAYAPLVVILLAIPVKKFKSLKRYFMCFGIMAGVGVVCYLIPTLITKIITRDIAVTLTDAEILQKEYFANNFIRFPIIVVCTLFTQAGFYTKSFLGVIGWLDTAFPPVIMFLLGASFFFCALTDMCSSKPGNLRARLLSLGGVLVFICGTIYAMYMGVNTVHLGLVGGNIAFGLQGRYFIPIFLFVLLTCSNTLLKKIPFSDKILYLREKTVSFTVFSILPMTVLLLLVRYWN